MSVHTGKFAAVTGGPAPATERRSPRPCSRRVPRLRSSTSPPDSLAEITDKYPAAIAVEGNVADAASVRKAAAQIQEQFGRLDILVNNAGIVRGTNFEELSVEEWDQVFAVNSTGPFLMSQAAMPLLKPGPRRGGEKATAAIVNITSVEAHIVISSSGHPQIHYNASKGALLQLTRALAVECASSRVRVNAVAPGFIETPFTKAVLGNQDVLNWLLERTPDGARRPARGRRQRRLVPEQREVQLGHRQHPLRRRRLDGLLRCPAPP